MENKQNTLDSLILKELKKAGKDGVLNTKLAETTLRYGAVIFSLREKGYEIETETVPSARRNSTFRYTLVRNSPDESGKRKKGYDILLEKLNELGGLITLADVEDVIRDNNLTVTHQSKDREIIKGDL